MNTNSSIPITLLSFDISAGFEEFQLESIVNYTPDTSNGKCQAEGNPQPTQNPIEIPVEAVLCRLFNENPHEARVSKCDWKCKSSQQTSQTGEEWKCHSYEEVYESIEDSKTRADPYRAWTICATCVASFKAVKDRHGVYLETAQAIKDD